MHLGEDLIVLGLLLLVAYVLGRLGKLVGLPAIPIYMIVGLLASPHTGWFPLDFESHYIELIAVFGSSCCCSTWAWSSTRTSSSATSAS